MDGRYLVLYDIADNRRLARAASIVLDYGVRVQKSVYEVRLTPHALAVLRRRLADVIEPQQDGVKIFPLCEACAARRRTCGADLPEMPAPRPWLVV